MKQTPPAAVGRRHLLEISASAAGVIALSACSGSPPEPGKGRPDTTPEQEVPVTAPEDLMREHGVLKRILLIYREGIRRLQADDQSPAPALNESAQIIRRFIEDYHGQLEEQYVFPKLEQAGKLTDITSVLRTQHQRGRVLTDRVLAATTAAAAFDQPARDTLAQDMAAYIRMFEPHEAREDTVVFPALRTLTPSRLTDDCIARFGSTTENHRLKWRPWLTGPNIDGTETPFPLRRTDIDPFEHVNNTIYWHGVHEILCQIPTLTAPYRAVLEYRSPIKSGEPLTIRYEQHDDVVRMHFVVGDDVRAAALLRRL